MREKLNIHKNKIKSFKIYTIRSWLHTKKNLRVGFFFWDFLLLLGCVTAKSTFTSEYICGSIKTWLQLILLKCPWWNATVISRKNICWTGTIAWPPWSTDLGQCNFFLWGYLKSVIYKTNPSIVTQLEENIRDEVRKNLESFRKSVCQNSKKFVRLDGRQLEYIV